MGAVPRALVQRFTKKGIIASADVSGTRYRKDRKLDSDLSRIVVRVSDMRGARAQGGRPW